MSHLQNFISTVLSPLSSKFDTKVYSKFCLFRTHLSTKYGQNRPFVHHFDTLFSPPRPLPDHEIFLSTLVTYQQSDVSLLSCTINPSVTTDPSTSTFFLSEGSTSFAVTIDSSTLTSSPSSFETPDIVCQFLSYFPFSFIHSVKRLINSNPPTFSISLNDFPCPYQVPAHIHTNNHPIHSPSYPQKFSFLYLGCHKEASNPRLSANEVIARFKSTGSFIYNFMFFLIRNTSRIFSRRISRMVELMLYDVYLVNTSRPRHEIMIFSFSHCGSILIRNTSRIFSRRISRIVGLGIFSSSYMRYRG